MRQAGDCTITSLAPRVLRRERHGPEDRYISEFVTKQIVAAQTLMVRLRERAEEGQGMVEYALILAFIAILVIVALKFLQPAISNTLNNVTNSL